MHLSLAPPAVEYNLSGNTIQAFTPRHNLNAYLSSGRNLKRYFSSVHNQKGYAKHNRNAYFGMKEQVTQATYPFRLWLRCPRMPL